MTEEKLPTPPEGGAEETPQGGEDDIFDEKPQGDAPESVDIQSIQEAIGRDDIKTKDDVVKWAKNITKYVGENEFSRKAQEFEEFKKATGKTPAEFLKSQGSQTSTPQGDEIREKVDRMEAVSEEPNIKFVMDEAKAIAKANGKTPLEVFRGNAKLQKLAADLAQEERSKNSITPPSGRLRIQGKTLEEMSLEETKENYPNIKNKILKKHGLA